MFLFTDEIFTATSFLHHNDDDTRNKKEASNCCQKIPFLFSLHLLLILFHLIDLFF
jgi:hypothetical protein